MSDIPRKTRLAVVERDRVCLRCGRGGTDLHHRQRRQVGGHETWNLVLLCRECHSWAHANPEAAREEGWIISSYDTEPSRTPLTDWQGRKITLEEKE